MAIYIRSAAAISIQEPLSNQWSKEPVGYAQPHNRCLEPDFKAFLDPIAARRMSRIIKRAAVTAARVTEESGIVVPDAVISGTGLGCVEDTEKFLTAMVNGGEEFLQPTYFIQSTHNTISSQIAIRLKCHGYNNTHVHRGISFESALFETALLFGCGRIKSALTGGYDELTPAYFTLLDRLGYWRKEVADTLNIIQHPGRGSFAGEGGVSFMLSAEKGAGALAELSGVELGYCPESAGAMTDRLLDRCGIKRQEIGLVMTGMNGDEENDRVYRTFLEKEFPLAEGAFYKPLCGEFFTAPAYGTYVAATCLQKGEVPARLMLNGKVSGNLRHILLYNHWQNREHSLILLTICGN